MDRSRQLLLGLLAVGVLGLTAELVLLEHMEEAWQTVPLVLLMSAVPLVVAAFRTPGRLTLTALQGVMVLFVVAGAVGIVLHLKGNLEFELELHPDASGWPLYLDVLKGATPALSPGAMAFLGMLGLGFVHRHPGWSRERDSR